MFSAMKFNASNLELIDQKRLPHEQIWIACNTLESVAKAIEDMVVRGAPAIGCAAAYGMAIDAMNHKHLSTWQDYETNFKLSMDRMAKTRPTAVNLFYALAEMQKTVVKFTPATPMQTVIEEIARRANALYEDDIRTCRAIGDHGADIIKKPANVLTHCNTGSLATAGYGTALGIVRSMHQRGHIRNVWVDETRPYLQGSRLTAFELGQDQIPYKLVTDNMAAYLMQLGQVDMVVVGADRIAKNGDTANKIGTYGLAVLCKHHDIPFVVAAPKATIDFKINSGKDIPVEERPAKELKEVQGISIAPVDANVWNPSFDVTPAELIYAIVTEHGVHRGPNFKLPV